MKNLLEEIIPSGESKACKFGVFGIRVQSLSVFGHESFRNELEWFRVDFRIVKHSPAHRVRHRLQRANLTIVPSIAEDDRFLGSRRPLNSSSTSKRWGRAKRKSLLALLDLTEISLQLTHR